MKRILVPIDFSKPAINAFRLALDVASQSKGMVHLLNVIELPVLHDTLLAPVVDFEQALLTELKTKSESEFKKLSNRYNKGGVKVAFDVEFGPVSKTIIDYIGEHDVDLVLMGSHGASGMREIFIGSNAEKIVRHSPVPVLVLKDYMKGPIKNIVFPNTLETEKREDLVMKVKALQAFFKARLHIVFINTPLNFTSDDVTHERLQKFAHRFMLKDYTINVFNSRDEEEGILQFSRQIDADLIAMGTHARKGLAHLIAGSLTEDIVNHTSGLVWTYAMSNEPVEA